MKKDITPFGLRMPTELKKRIEESALYHHRSINTDVIERLMVSLDDEKSGLESYTTGELIQELINRGQPGRISIEISGPLLAGSSGEGSG